MPSRQWRAARRKALKEAAEVEKKIGWHKGSLSNESGWPDPPPDALSKKEIAARDRAAAEQRRLVELQIEAEQAERWERIGQVVEDLGYLGPGMDPKLQEAARIGAGKDLEEGLEAAGFFISVDYDDYD